jgi:hypothetical protein
MGQLEVRSRVANTLVKAGIFAAEDLEEGGHGVVLVHRPRKVLREAATREGRRHLRMAARRSADARDPGTCAWTMW